MALNCKCNPHPKDGPWAWLVCISAAISHGFVFGVMASYGIFLPVFVEKFQENREKTAWAGSIALSLTFLVGPIPVALSQRFGYRAVTIASALLCAISLVASSFATGIIYLYFSYGVFYGCGSGCVVNAGFVMPRRYFTDKRRALSTGIVVSGGSLGVMVMGPTLQALVDALGWRHAFRVMAGFMMVVCLVGATYDPNIKTEDGNENQVVQRTPLRLSSFIDFSLYKSPIYSVGTVSIVLGGMAMFVPNIHLIRFAKDLNIPATKAAQLFIYIGVSSTVFRIIIGRVLDKRWVTPLQAVQLSVLMMGVTIIAQAFATTFIHLVAFAVAYGIGTGFFITAQADFFQSSVEPHKSAMGLGMGYMAKAVLTLGGPPAAGFIADEFGSYIPSFYVIGGILVFAAIFPFVLLLRKSGSQPPADIESEKQVADMSGKPMADSYETAL